MFIRANLLITILLFCLSFTVTAGGPAPEFTLPIVPSASPDADYKGSEISLKDLKGRVVLLDFWATWCPPCRKSFPWMDEMYSRYKKDGLIVVAISEDSKRELVERFIEKMNPLFPIAYDPTGEVAEKFNLRGMPTSYLIDREGNIAIIHVGFRNSDKDKLEADIKMILKR